MFLFCVKRNQFVFRFLSIFLNLTAACVLASFGQENCSKSGLFSEKSCAGDFVSPEETALFQLINRYRISNNQPELRLSAPLSMLANRRLLDLKLNMRSLTHSWSNCAYDLKDAQTWTCVLDSPKRLKTGYDGQGYEALYRTSAVRAMPEPALQAWQKSTLHNSIILNQGDFSAITWDEFGVGIDGQYAVLWFGSPGTASKGMPITETGLGVSYEQTIAGLTKILKFDESSTSVEARTWIGVSADKKIKLEIFGNKKDINETNLAVSIMLEDGKLTQESKTAASTLLKNIFSEWADREAWIETSLAAILADRTASRTKLIRKAAIQLSSGANDTVILLVKPAAKPSYIEIF
jgi:uncharacterized protein YkwD